MEGYELEMKVHLFDVHIRIREWRACRALQHNAVVWMWFTWSVRAGTHAHSIQGAIKRDIMSRFMKSKLYVQWR